MNKYFVIIKRAYDDTFSVEANDKEEAYRKACEIFDEYTISGSEMYEEDEEITEYLQES